MINKLNPQRNVPNQNIKNIDTVKSKSSAQSAKSSTSASNVVPRSVSSPANLGLPADKLSSSIISFARFFSLPLKPQLLADIRRSAFTPEKIPAPASNTAAATAATQGEALTAAKFREALSLAASAAESKGAELQPKGLELYAQAIDPGWEKRNDGEKSKRNKGQTQQEDESPIKIKSANDTQPEPVTAEVLKKLYYENTREDTLLDILNRLPGKNGQRWIVLPFDFSQGRREYKVSMRILTDDNRLSAGACRMALDVITEDHGTGSKEGEKRILFVIEAANDKPLKITVYIKGWFPVKSQSKYKLELSESFKVPPERIIIKTSEESFPYEAGFSQLSFCSVDKEA